MGIYSWVKELPQGTYVLPTTNDLRDAKDRPRDSWRRAVFTQSTYEGIDHYECSTPTGPSAGRIYRRLHRYRDKINQPFVFVVYNDSLQSGQIHIPFIVHVIKGH